MKLTQFERSNLELKCDIYEFPKFLELFFFTKNHFQIRFI
jgi:hypothetical protein